MCLHPHKQICNQNWKMKTRPLNRSILAIKCQKIYKFKCKMDIFVNFFQRISFNDFSHDLKMSVLRSDKCLNKTGSYVGKLSEVFLLILCCIFKLLIMNTLYPPCNFFFLWSILLLVPCMCKKWMKLYHEKYLHKNFMNQFHETIF